MNDRVEFTSLCSVWTDSYDRIWLSRLADLKNGKLDIPIIDEELPKFFGNRDRLYYTNGPSRDGAVGIWKWSASPRDSNATKDFITSDFQYGLHPTRFIQIKHASTLEQLGKLLLEGIAVHKYECDTFFAYENASGVYEGVLCEAKELIFENKICLKKDVCSLPIYRFGQGDIITIKNSMRFIKVIPLPPVTERLYVGSLNESIKAILIDRMTWPLYKDCIGRTKAEWRNCKTLFERVCDESLYESIADKMGCTLAEATELISNFIERSNFLLEKGDIDSDVLARIAMNHDDLRAQCEAAVEEHWKTTHAEVIAEAQKELDQKKQAAENIVNEYKFQLEKIKADKKDAEEAHQKILRETADAQAKFDRLLKEIEEYEVLGANTVQAIRDKIGLAQQDMAGFIAELSTFMPQQSVQGDSANRWTFTPGEVCHSMDNMEGCSGWKDTFELLCDNLQLAGIGSQWTIMLSSFLYSAYLNRMPLLLAGPNAKAIADALSMTIYGKKVDLLKCCGEQDAEALSCFVESDMAAVQNPFHPDWISCISHFNNGFALWLHPFTEDLQIEPRSLYHYAYPVFTECFVDQIPSAENMDAGQETVEYDEFKPDPKYRAKVGTVKKLGLSRLMLSRLEKVLADAKCMGAISDTSMECLFGLLPMCVLSGKQEILPELLDSEKNIKPEVKAEIQRYIEE